MSFSFLYFTKFFLSMLVIYYLVFLFSIWLKSRINTPFISRWFTMNSGIKGYVLAALLGAATPFCSCTTIPIFAAMIENDIKLGYAISFFIASPTLNPPAILLFYALFGAQLTLIYCILCLAIAIVGGLVLSSDKLKLYLIDFLFFGDEVKFNFKEVSVQYFSFMKYFVFILLFAASIAAVMVGWIPSESLLNILSNNELIAIPGTVLLGGIIYADITMLIPIGNMLLAKGFSPSLIFSFMMAASGVGLPGLIILTHLFKLKLLILYMITLFILFSLSGYIIHWGLFI